MANLDDVKTMLTSLLKASKLNLSSKEAKENKDGKEEYSAADGYDFENPLAQTDLYRDELGNLLPTKMHVVPLAGRPILPSQISTVQLSIQWLDVITEVISSSHHTFALFAVDEDNDNKNLSAKDFPETGTVVRLLSARSSHDEIDLICEGVRRVGIVEPSSGNRMATVRYPEIEYRLASPSTRDRLFANTQALRDSLTKSMEFEKKILDLRREQREYARSIGIELIPKIDSFDLSYYLYHDQNNIGCLSWAKLKSLFAYLGLEHLSDEIKQQIAIYLARPSQAEINRLNEYHQRIKDLVYERGQKLRQDLARLAPRSRELAASFLSPTEKVITGHSTNSDVTDADTKADSKSLEQVPSPAASQDLADTIAAARAARAAAATAADTAVGTDAAEIPAAGNTSSAAGAADSVAQGNTSERSFSDVISELSSLVSVDALRNRPEGYTPQPEPEFLVANTFNNDGIDARNQAESKDYNQKFMQAMAALLEGRPFSLNNSQTEAGAATAAGDKGAAAAAADAATAAAGDVLEQMEEKVAGMSAAEISKRREDLFALIAKVGRAEEKEARQAEEQFRKLAVAEILKNAPQDRNDASANASVSGPNIGFVNEDTSVVTFMPGQEASEDLLLRLTEIQKQHEQMLAREAKARDTIAEADKESTAVSSETDTADSSEFNIGSGLTPHNSITIDSGSNVISSGVGTSILGGEDTETHIVVKSDNQRMSDDFRELLGYLMKGKDLTEIALDESGEAEEDNPEEGSKATGSKTADSKTADKDGADKKRRKHRKSDKWGALQRAALIRSKLASILGGKVIFGVSELNAQQEGAQREVETRAYCLGVTAALQELIPLNPLMTDEMKQYLARFDISNPSILADCAASITNAKPKELQEVLDTVPVLPRLRLVFKLVTRELSAARLQDKIRASVTENIQKRQKDFFLREQLNEIKKELGLTADEKDLDVEKFKERMAKLNPPEHVKKRFEEELAKLSLLETASPEYGGTRNYIDILTSIPWGKKAKDRIALKKNSSGKAQSGFSLEQARKILDEDHEGLQDVKDRIIEFLAVGALKGETSGQIMLFVGPPGVGKTSIGKSIARALNRPFYRLSLGGIDDVSEIKGHRKTYVGAMPGKIVAALRETGVMNPVIMLDEIDKLGRSYHGDPDSALLETLDPEQNKNFLDVYLDEKMDLSGCLFICTANSTETISAPLLDRMEPIRLSGYIAKEKFAIASKHLLPRAYKDAGIKPKSRLKIPDETITALIDGYARESGVRSLERAIAKLIRKSAVKLVEGSSKVTITPDDLEEYLGTAPFKKEKMLKGIGIMTGLAWTSVGGVTLPVESIITNFRNPGLKLTGSLGDVMKESANIAYSYVQSHLGQFADLNELDLRAEQLYGQIARPETKEDNKAKNSRSRKGKNSDNEDKEAKPTFFERKTIHLHVPEGAIPKDGPSAGVTMATSLLSLALSEPPKAGYAMTGELTLTGHVLTIGGLREKVIAARRMGIFNIVIPIGNEGDVRELPEQVRSNVTFTYADTYRDVACTLFDSVKEYLSAQGGFTPPRSEHFDSAGMLEAAEKQPVKAASTAAKAKAPTRKTTARPKAPAKAPAKAETSTRMKTGKTGSESGSGDKTPAKPAKIAKGRTKAQNTAKARAESETSSGSKASGDPAAPKATSTRSLKSKQTKGSAAHKSSDTNKGSDSSKG